MGIFGVPWSRLPQDSGTPLQHCGRLWGVPKARLGPGGGEMGCLAGTPTLVDSCPSGSPPPPARGHSGVPLPLLVRLVVRRPEPSFPSPRPWPSLPHSVSCGGLGSPWVWDAGSGGAWSGPFSLWVTGSGLPAAGRGGSVSLINCFARKSPTLPCHPLVPPPPASFSGAQCPVASHGVSSAAPLDSPLKATLCTHGLPPPPCPTPNPWAPPSLPSIPSLQPV